MISISQAPSTLFIYEDDSTLRDALIIIQNNKEKIALIVNKSYQLISIITDGDIRRALLSGKDLESLASDCVKKKFIFLNENEKEISFLITKTFRASGIRQLPILSKQGLVVDLYYLDDSIELLSNPVVLMAGGKGTRLHPHTIDCPKPMIKVNGKPMLEILIENFIRTGFDQFYISVNYLKEQIIDHFKDGSKWGANIKYLIEEKPLGTAGSLKMLPKNLSEPFIVMNGDVLTRLNPVDLINFHEQQNSIATICVKEHPVPIPFGVVQADGSKLKSFSEKPIYNYLVNAGVYVLSPKILDLIDNDVYTDMPSLFLRAQERSQNVSVFPIHEYWIDVGNPDSLKKADSSWGHTHL